MKIIKKLIVLLIVLLAIAGISTYLFLNNAVPKYNGTLKIPSLNNDVKVYHDTYGIPHIIADNKQDAFIALGYLHAQERLFQMELIRRIGAGTLSEILGEDLLEVDKLFRTIGVNEKAKAEAKKQFAVIDTEAEEMAMAYLKGINQFIDEGATPPEFTLMGIPKTHFEPVDLFRVVGYMGFSFAAGLKTDPLFQKIYEQLGADYYQDCSPHADSNYYFIPSTRAKGIDSLSEDVLSTAIHQVLEKIPVPLFLGSNSWVVSPNKSQSGQVLFCNDAHIQYSQPSVWWEAHIETPDFSLYGNYLAGFPFALIGHTKKHSWGITMFENDDMDFYYEQISYHNATYKGEQVPLSYRVENYTIKDKLEPVIDTVWSTNHGPLINGISQLTKKSKPVSMFWTQSQLPLNVIEVGYGLSQAKSISEFEQNLAHHNAPGLNFMYGDAEGNIAWWATAKLPKRPKHVDSKLILDGASGKDEIIGYHPFSSNPHSINPESGFVYSANNAPAQLLDSQLYPGYYYAGARGQAISLYLSQSKKFTTDDMKSLLLDNKGPFHVKNMQLICSLISSDDADIQNLIQKLKDWDGNHQKESIEPTIYYTLMYEVLKLAMQDELGEADFDHYLQTLAYMKTYHHLIRKNNSVWWDNIDTEITETKQQIIQLAFDKTLTKLSASFGENYNIWQWNKAFTLTHNHPLGKVQLLTPIFNVGPMPLDGGIEVINKQSFQLNDASNFVCKAGPSKRIVIDFADIASAESINPTGQSGHVLSKHYDDQFMMHINGEFRPMQMNMDAILQLENVLLLKAN